MKKLVLVLLASLVSGTALADACFYEHDGMNGREMCLRDGDRIDNLDRTGWNDTISSMSVDRNSEVYVCSDAYFRGNCRTLGSDEYNFDRSGFNDQISSIEVRRTWGSGGGAREACFYTGWNYSGAEFCLSAGEEVRNLDRTGFNDQISSISIPRGLSVTVCEHDRFRGWCRTLDSDVMNFNGMGMNDQISSVRVEGRRR